MYKLIAIDCDGTLLNSKRKITERTITAIKMARDSGIKIVLASARPAYRLKQFLEPLGLLSSDQYLISLQKYLYMPKIASIPTLTKKPINEITQT